MIFRARAYHAASHGPPLPTRCAVGSGGSVRIALVKEGRKVWSSDVGVRVVGVGGAVKVVVVTMVKGLCTATGDATMHRVVRHDGEVGEAVRRWGE